MQSHTYLAEIAVLKHNLTIAHGEAKVAISNQPQPQTNEVAAAAPENGKIVGRSSLSSLALPLHELQYRTVLNLPSIPVFETPRVGAWDWVTTAEGELVITRVITTLLHKYSGSAACDASSLFLDIGANSG